MDMISFIVHARYNRDLIHLFELYKEFRAWSIRHGETNLNNEFIMAGKREKPHTRGTGLSDTV